MPRYSSLASRRSNDILSAWEEFAEGVVFANQTLEQLRTAMAPSLAIRGEIAKLKQQLRAKKTEGSIADTAVAPLLRRVVDSIKGNPDFGPDCALYEACGYIRDSDRRSGLTRKGTMPPGGSPAPVPSPTPNATV